LPNVFTALADIALGACALAAGATEKAGWLPYPWLMLASACLYGAGMVWNDYFDVEQDRRERAFRPLPSGRIAARSAARLGSGLLVLGVSSAAVAGWQGGTVNWLPTAIAFAMSACILLYDSWLK